MRRRGTAALAAVMVGAAGCGAGDQSAAPVIIEDFARRSPAVECTAADYGEQEDLELADLTRAGDTAIVALYGSDRVLAVYDLELRRLARIELPKDGPGGVEEGGSAVLVEDSLFYVTDQARRVVKILSLTGRERETIHLDAVPQRLRVARDTVLVSVQVQAPRQESPLYALRGAHLRPLPVPVHGYPNRFVRPLGNLLVVEPLAGGRIFAARQFLRPTGYVLDGSGATHAREVQVPLSDGVRSSLGFVPDLPRQGEDAMRMLVPVIAASGDPASGGLYYLTRAGRKHQTEPWGRAIIRLDPEFEFQAAHRLNVNAVQMVFLPGRATAIVVNEEDQWFTCPTP